MLLLVVDAIMNDPLSLIPQALLFLFFGCLLFQPKNLENSFVSFIPIAERGKGHYSIHCFDFDAVVKDLSSQSECLSLVLLFGLDDVLLWDLEKSAPKEQSRSIEV